MSTPVPRRALAEPNPYEAPAEPDDSPPVPTDATVWLRDLDWRQFENLVANAYRLQGYEVTVTRDGADGGIDLVLTRPGERILVQCKHWRSYQVGAPVVRELFGLVVAHRATGGIVVTSGRFSQEAEVFAREQGVQLLNGTATLQLVTTSMVAPSAPPLASAADNGLSGVPDCPVCGSPTALRRARRGSHAGEHFWGCTRFPACRGMVQLPPAPMSAAGSPTAPATASVAVEATPMPRGGPSLLQSLRTAVIRVAGLVVIMITVSAAMYVVTQLLAHVVLAK